MALTAYHLDRAPVAAKADGTEAHDYIIHLEEDADADAVAALQKALGAEVVEATQTWGFELWRTNTAIRADALAAFADTSWYGAVSTSITYLQPDLMVSATDFTTDPGADKLWNLDNPGGNNAVADADVDAPEAWQKSRGQGVVVAVLDTGVDYTHPDLAANMWINHGEIPGNALDDDGNGYADDVYGYDFVYNDGSPMDVHGHGTHVAGTIAAVEGNGVGIAGVAPEAQIMALKILNDSGSGSTFDAIQALDYAVQMGAQVSNASWGGGVQNIAFDHALAMANDAGHVFVAAAGNDGVDLAQDPHFPASYTSPNVISVGATTKLDQLAYYSNRSLDDVHVTAPGSSIYSTLPGGGYGTKSGTSMAAPHVSGAAALLLSLEPWLTPEELRQRLIDTSDVKSSLYAHSVSHGRINAAAALEAGPGNRLSGQLVDGAGQGLSGWQVFLDANGNGALDAGEASTETDARGVYQFEGLSQGDYSLNIVLQPGYRAETATDRYQVDQHDTASGWQDISAAGQRLYLGDDARVEIELPFALTLWDISVESLFVSANGLLSARSPGRAFAPDNLGDAGPFSLAPMWMDLTLAHGGAIYVGAISDSIWVVQYEDIRGFDGSGPYSFQVLVHQDGDIDVVYRPGHPIPAEAVMGIKGADATQTITWSPQDIGANGGRVSLTTKPNATLATPVRIDGPETQLAPITVSNAEEQFAQVITTDVAQAGPLQVDFGLTFRDPVVFLLDSQTGVLSGLHGEDLQTLSVSRDHLILDVPMGTPAGTVALVVFEAGTWRLDDGTMIEVGRHTTDRLSSDGFDHIAFTQNFTATPLVFSQVQTSDDDLIYTRQAGSGTDGARLALERPEAQNHGRAEEAEIGWLAIQPGTDIGGASGIGLGAFEAQSAGNLATATLPDGFRNAPFVLTQLATAHDSDPARAETVFVSDQNASAAVVEDQSLDAETGHAGETVTVLAASGAGTLTGYNGIAPTVWGTVWNDTDGDGQRDLTESGLADQIVFWDRDEDGIWDAGELSTRTDVDGRYHLGGLVAGHFTMGLVPSDDQAQVHAIGGDASPTPGVVVQALDPWEDISQTGQRLTELDEDGALSMSLPFLFPFFGKNHDTVTISTNGYLSFGGDGSLASPNAAVAGPFVAAFWTDLSFGNTGVIYTWMDPEGQKLIVQYSDMVEYGGTGAVGVQVVLYADGRVSIRFDEILGMDGAGLIGVGDGAGTIISPGAGGAPSSDLSFSYVPAAGARSQHKVAVGEHGVVSGVDFIVTPSDVSSQANSTYASVPNHASQGINAALGVLENSEGAGLDWV